MIEQVLIENYKSIKDLSLPLNRLNVLIGSNGAGKSNFISFFELTKAIYEQRFGSYTLSKGGIDNLLRQGRKVSPSIQGLIDFDNTNAFFFEIKPSQSNKGYIEKTGDFFNNCHKPGKDYSQWNRTIWDSAVEESSLKDNKRWRAAYLRKYLGSFTVYHFHDTSATSPMRGDCPINDNEYLRDNGSNLAAYLYSLMLKQLPVYGDGMQIRDWLYVEDHCKAIDMVANGGKIGEVYNVGGHNERPNIFIVKTIISQLHDRLQDEGISEELIKHVADRLGHDRRYGIDPTKIKNDLGWYPETPFEKGIVLTIDWYLNHQEWMDHVTSGDYQNYYQDMYKNK